MSYCVEEKCEKCGCLIAYTCDSVEELYADGYFECECK